MQLWKWLASLLSVRWMNAFAVKQVSGTLLNTGRDLRVILDEPSLGHSVNITGGPLSYQYRITEILLHFGSISSLGSEHTIAGVSFPAEVSLRLLIFSNTKVDDTLAKNRRLFQALVSGAGNHDTPSRQMILAEKNEDEFRFYINSFFLIALRVEKTFVTPLYFLFLFTNKRAVQSSAQTNQSQFSFPAVFRHEIEHALTGAGFWHQKSMTDRPVSGTSWLVPETGAWNWPVCHHLKIPRNILLRHSSISQLPLFPEFLCMRNSVRQAVFKCFFVIKSVSQKFTQISASADD